MNGDWLRDESNYDTIEKNCDWIMGPSNREVHAVNGNHETVTIISANMTCWARHAETVLAMKADALVLQETRLTRLTQVRGHKKGSLPGLRRGLGSRHETDKNTTSREKPGRQRSSSQIDYVRRCRYPREPENLTWPSCSWYQRWRTSDFGRERTVFARSNTPTARRRQSSFFTAPICTWNRNLTHQRKLARSE